MKKWLVWLTLAVMLFSFAAFPAAAEEPPAQEIPAEEIPDTEFSEENEGTVEVVTDPEAAAEIMEEDEGEDAEAFIPDELEKTIFGKDDRVTVKASSYPYSTVAYMVVKAQCGCSWVGTGFMVSKNRMLTAAHCMVCHTHGKWAKNLTLYFGHTSRKKYVYKYSGKWYAWSGDLFSNKAYRVDYDFACVRLYKDVGKKTGWLKPAWSASDRELNGKWVTVAGYRDGKLKAAAGSIATVWEHHLGYTIDTLAGSSGGPVFDSDYRVYGINIAGSDTENIAFRIDDWVKDAYNKANKK